MVFGTDVNAPSLNVRNFVLSNSLMTVHILEHHTAARSLGGYNRTFTIDVRA